MASEFSKIKISVYLPRRHHEDLRIIHEMRTTVMTRNGIRWSDTLRMIFCLGLKQYKQSERFGKTYGKFKRIKSNAAGTTGTDHDDVLSFLIDTL